MESRTATTAQLPSEVRVGDRERQSTADVLGRALADGYLDLAEYESRLQAAYTADTGGVLNQLVADLPVGRLRRRHAAHRPGRQRSTRRRVALYLVMVIVVLAVWLAVGLSTGAWYFWPMWPILGAGIGMFWRVSPMCSSKSK